MGLKILSRKLKTLLTYSKVKKGCVAINAPTQQHEIQSHEGLMAQDIQVIKVDTDIGGASKSEKCRIIHGLYSR